MEENTNSVEKSESGNEKLHLSDVIHSFSVDDLRKAYEAGKEHCFAKSINHQLGYQRRPIEEYDDRGFESFDSWFKKNYV